MTLSGAIFLHGFGQRYDLPIGLTLYLLAAGGVVVISFVMVVLFAGDQLGAKAIRYPKRPSPALLRIARTPWPRLVGGTLGVLGLLAIIVCGLFGSADPAKNPAEYLLWIYFWAGTVIASGLVGNIWTLLNPFSAIHDIVKRFLPGPPPARLPAIGVWPAVGLYFLFADLELASGVANRPWLIGTLALSFTLVMAAGMLVFGRDPWLNSCEPFTVLFGIVGKFGPVESERDPDGKVTAVYLRPWGAGLLDAGEPGWDRVVFVILMLSSLAFDGLLATTAWFTFEDATIPLWTPLGGLGLPVIKTIGILLLTACFFFVFTAFMQLVIYLGRRSVDAKTTISAFALTLVPIALVYNAAHNYSYLVVQSQGLWPLLNDPLGRGSSLWPAIATYKPSFALAQASTVWYAQIVLIVIGHVIAVYLSHLRAGERFRTAQNVLLSQYPMLLLMVMYTMTSLWILAQPITRGG